MKKITIVTPCYNEEGNVETLYLKVSTLFETQLQDYQYEHIFIDNDSSDKTVSILKEIAKKDKRIKIIVNNRNFGHIRSPHHALLQSDGDATILMVADLQDPPDMIPKFIEKWEKTSCDAVLGVKNQSLESPLMFLIR